MKHRLFILIAALLTMLAGAACAATLPADLTAIEEGAFEGDAAITGVMTLPEGVAAVGSRAFAATGLHGLVVPEGCGSVAADALADTQAAYILLKDAGTVVAGEAMADAAFVFAPMASSAAEMPGFYPLETLAEVGGLYYSVTDREAIPLCAVDGTALSGVLELPKLIGGQPLRSLETLNLRGCGSVTALCIPSCVPAPDWIASSAYAAMSVTPPVPSVTEAMEGDSVTWTTSVEGAYGDVAYIWKFDVDGVISSIITSTPTITLPVAAQGLWIASVTAVDALDDRASAAGAGVTVGPAIPQYRALLIGNLYEGQSNPLHGCDTDVAAMRTVLGSMTGSGFSIQSHIDLNADGIRSAISSAFANTRTCDVSLFYYSGHGTAAGSLVGTGNTTISVSELRTLLDQISGTKIVIVDACYSGNLIGKSTDAASPASFTNAFVSGFSSYTKDNLASNGYIVMTACSMNQLSQSLSDGTISFGAFTYGLCYGSGFDEWNQRTLATLPADTNGDGAITLGEAYSMAVKRVSWLGTMVTLNQTAQCFGDDSFVLWHK